MPKAASLLQARPLLVTGAAACAQEGAPRWRVCSREGGAGGGTRATPGVDTVGGTRKGRASPLALQMANMKFRGGGDLLKGSQRPAGCGSPSRPASHCRAFHLPSPPLPSDAAFLSPGPPTAPLPPASPHSSSPLLPHKPSSSRSPPSPQPESFHLQKPHRLQGTRV